MQNDAVEPHTDWWQNLRKELHIGTRRQKIHHVDSWYTNPALNTSGERKPTWSDQLNARQIWEFLVDNVFTLNFAKNAFMFVLKVIAVIAIIGIFLAFWAIWGE